MRIAKWVFPRLAVVILAAVLAFVIQTRPALAQIPACPIEGCNDDPGPSCGVCETINGTYAVYKSF